MKRERREVSATPAESASHGNSVKLDPREERKRSLVGEATGSDETSRPYHCHPDRLPYMGRPTRIGDRPSRRSPDVSTFPKLIRRRWSSGARAKNDSMHEPSTEAPLRPKRRVFGDAESTDVLCRTFRLQRDRERGNEKPHRAKERSKDCLDERTGPRR